MPPPPPTLTLFPYTTLFRSRRFESCRGRPHNRASATYSLAHRQTRDRPSHGPAEPSPRWRSESASHIIHGRYLICQLLLQQDRGRGTMSRCTTPRIRRGTRSARHVYAAAAAAVMLLAGCGTHDASSQLDSRKTSERATTEQDVGTADTVAPVDPERADPPRRILHPKRSSARQPIRQSRRNKRPATSPLRRSSPLLVTPCWRWWTATP